MTTIVFRHALLPILLQGWLISQLHAQTRPVLIQGYPAGSILHIDGVKATPPPGTYALTPGQHHVKMWAPKFEMLDTTIQVADTATQRVVIKLKHTQAYYQYVKAMDTYKIQKSKPAMWGVGTMLSVGFGTAAWAVLNGKSGVIKTDIRETNAQYDAAIDQIEMDALRDIHEVQMEDLKAVRAQKWLVGSVAGALAGVFTFKVIQTHHRNKGLEQPTFHQEPLLSVSPTILNGPEKNTAGLYLAIQF